MFESAFRDAAIGMALVSLEGHFLKVNDALCSLLGYARHDLLATNFQALTHPDDLADDLTRLRQLVEGLTPSYHMEKRYLRADGRVVRTLLTVSLVRDAHGAPEFFISQIQDVTARRTAESEAELFFEGSLDMLALANVSGVLERVNGAWQRVLGWTPDELTAKPFLEFVHGDDRASVRLLLAAFATGQAAQGARCRVCCKDGGHRWLEWTVRPIEGGALCAARDVSEQVAQEQRLRLSQRALASVSDGVLITDPTQPDNPVVYCNASFERITGYREQDLVGRSCRVLQGDDRDQPELHALREALREERGCHVVLRNYRKDGELVLNSLNITPVRNAAGQVTNYVGSVEDITERVHMEDQIRRAALTDELTGLYNRRGFLLLAEQQMRLAARHRQAMGLLFVDVDGMKRINDELGHDSGDDALIDVATILHRVLRSSDVVARLGGDEFVALVEGDADDVDVLRARLLETLSRHNQIANRAYRIALSVGSSICVPDRPVSLNELIARADEAMYAVKRRRRAAHAN
ncbi:MAG: PAS domain S-box protein [Polyangiales bacterium]